MARLLLLILQVDVVIDIVNHIISEHLVQLFLLPALGSKLFVVFAGDFPEILNPFHRDVIFLLFRFVVFFQIVALVGKLTIEAAEDPVEERRS